MKPGWRRPEGFTQWGMVGVDVEALPGGAWLVLMWRLCPVGPRLRRCGGSA